MNNSSCALVRLFFSAKKFHIANSHKNRICKTTNSTLFRLVSNTTSSCNINKKVSKEKKSLDTLISNLNQKGITKHSSKNVLKTKTQGSMPDDLDYIKIPNKKSRNKCKPDELCDIKISEHINSEKKELIQMLLTYVNVNRYPSKQMLNKLAASLVDSRELDAINKVRQICSIAYPNELQYNMNYQHYEAEILWKEGKYKESINLFEKLIFQYPKGRKKLCDMLKFLIRKLIANNIEEDLKLLMCLVQRCAKEGIYHPASNFWQEAFVSGFTLHHQLAEELVSKNPEIKEFVIIKIDSVLAKAYELNEIQIIQRLIEVLLALQITTEYSKVFSALMEFHCMENNYRGAKETFSYILKEKIYITPEACSKYMNLLSSRRLQVPFSLLDIKYRVSTLSPKFKF